MSEYESPKCVENKKEEPKISKLALKLAKASKALEQSFSQKSNADATKQKIKNYKKNIAKLNLKMQKQVKLIENQKSKIKEQKEKYAKIMRSNFMMQNKNQIQHSKDLHSIKIWLEDYATDMQKTTKSHQEILQTNEECKSNILKEFYENRNILKDSIDILKIYGHEISHLQQKNENLLKNIQNKTSQNYAMKNELRRSNETMTALRNEFLKFVEINSDWESITENLTMKNKQLIKFNDETVTKNEINENQIKNLNEINQVLNMNIQNISEDKKEFSIFIEQQENTIENLNSSNDQLQKKIDQLKYQNELSENLKNTFYEISQKQNKKIQQLEFLYEEIQFNFENANEDYENMKIFLIHKKQLFEELKLKNVNLNSISTIECQNLKQNLNLKTENLNQEKLTNLNLRMKIKNLKEHLNTFKDTLNLNKNEIKTLTMEIEKMKDIFNAKTYEVSEMKNQNLNLKIHCEKIMSEKQILHFNLTHQEKHFLIIQNECELKNMEILNIKKETIDAKEEIKNLYSKLGGKNFKFEKLITEKNQEVCRFIQKNLNLKIENDNLIKNTTLKVNELQIKINKLNKDSMKKDAVNAKIKNDNWNLQNLKDTQLMKKENETQMLQNKYCELQELLQNKSTKLLHLKTMMESQLEKNKNTEHKQIFCLKKIEKLNLQVETEYKTTIEKLKLHIHKLNQNLKLKNNELENTKIISLEQNLNFENIKETLQSQIGNLNKNVESKSNQVTNVKNELKPTIEKLESQILNLNQSLQLKNNELENLKNNFQEEKLNYEEIEKILNFQIQNKLKPTIEKLESQIINLNQSLQLKNNELENEKNNSLEQQFNFEKMEEKLIAQIENLEFDAEYTNKKSNKFTSKSFIKNDKEKGIQTESSSAISQEEYISVLDELKHLKQENKAQIHQNVLNVKTIGEYEILMKEYMENLDHISTEEENKEIKNHNGQVHLFTEFASLILTPNDIFQFAKENNLEVDKEFIESEYFALSNTNNEELALSNTNNEELILSKEL